MKVSIGKWFACLAALVGLSELSTAKAGVTLVITVSDANGSATDTFTTTANSYTFNNTGITFNSGISANTISGTASVLGDFNIATTGSTNTPGIGNSNSNTSDTTNIVDYTNKSGTGGSTGTVVIGVYPTGYTFPGTTGSPAYVSSLLQVSNGVFNSIGFTTYLAQSSGTFTPGFQSVDQNTNTTGKIYSPFTRSGATFNLYNVTTFNLPVDSSGNDSDAITSTGTSTVSLTRPSGTQTTPVATPEPATLAMAIAGLPVVGFIAWRRRRNRSSGVA